MTSKNRMLVLGMTLLALGAGCGGTGTGNPVPTAPAGSTAPSTAAASVLNTICTKLTSCFGGLSAAQCLTGVSAQTNLAAAFGLSAGFGSFQAVMDAESAGTLHPHATPQATCLSDLTALTCAGTAVQSAYSAGAPTDFSNVVNLIPTSTSSCKGLY